MTYLSPDFYVILFRLQAANRSFVYLKGYSAIRAYNL